MLSCLSTRALQNVSKDAIDKIKARQFSAGYKKPLLTKREMQIMHCLVGGKINKEIASALGLSTNTVRNHLRSIFVKLCVETRAEAIVRYLNKNDKNNCNHE
jgi:DNA-binding NarL/FixJ family response regulator